MTSQRLLTRPLKLVFTTNFSALTSFYLLLSVVPAHATVADPGLLTAALMFATVIGELATPRLAARIGDRNALAAGLLLLGAPAFALVIPGNTALVLVVCALRGLGFAVTVVICGALTAIHVPPSRRGEGLGISGIVAGIPAVVALPAGVWLADHVGTTPVYLAAAIAALIAIPAVYALPASATTPVTTGILAGLRNPALRRPALLFAATTTALGALVTYLPALTGSAAPAALLAESTAATIAGWQAGRHADRHHPAGQLAPGLAIAALGLLAIALPAGTLITIIGALVFGTGFGITLNASINLMYASVPTSAYGTASALWNLGYDGGMGAGAAGIGLVAGHTGIRTALAGTAILIGLCTSATIKTHHDV